MTSFKSLQYFSVLKIILQLQNYSTIWIYSDEFHSDVIGEYFMEQYGFRAKSFFDLNNLRDSNSPNFDLERQYFPDTLHIFFTNQYLDETIFDHVKIDDNIVVIAGINNTVDRFLPLKNYGYFPRKMLFVINSSLYRLKPSKSGLTFESSTNLNESTISTFVRKTFLHQCSYSQLNMNGSVLKTFFRQKGPNSFITAFNNKLMLFGPDGFVTQELAKRLNATVDCQTDFANDYPDYKNFFYNGGYTYNNFIYFYKELITTNEISSFNQRFVSLCWLLSKSQLTNIG